MLPYHRCIFFTKTSDLIHNLPAGIRDDLIRHSGKILSDIIKSAFYIPSKVIEPVTYTISDIPDLLQFFRDILLEILVSFTGFISKDRDHHIKTLLHKLHLVTGFFDLYKHHAQVHGCLE